MVGSMPPAPNKDDLEATWAFLEAGVDKIMGNLTDGMDMASYMSMYSAVYNFCTSQKAVASGGGMMGGNAHRGGKNNSRSIKVVALQLYAAFPMLESSHGQHYKYIISMPCAENQTDAAHLLGEDVYRNLKRYLRRHAEGLFERSKDYLDEALLAYYIREWDRYTSAAVYIFHLFRYLNRHWVKREVDEGKKDVYDVYTLHLVSWRQIFFERVHTNVMNAVLGMVKRQRDGDSIEQSHIKSIVDSCVSLGLDEADSSRSTLDVYRLHFEKPFLEATEQYYQHESAQFIAQNSVVEYMRKAETRLQEEKDRVGLYLHPDIMTPLMKTCLCVLVTDHRFLLRDEFQVLLDQGRHEDLARMYRLLARIADGLEPLRAVFQSHVKKCGLAAVEKAAGDGESSDPKVYVDALLDVHGRYQNLVETAFKGDTEFVRSLDNACKEFVNRNKVCASGSSRSPELLAKYTDALLKRGGKSAEEADLEASLNQVMTIFKFIEDKDVFQKFYSRALAKRLVQSSSVSEDVESSMIGKLKEACGYEYTNKLQRMFQDVQISADLNNNFTDWARQMMGEEDWRRAIDSTYHILGTGSWPLTPPNTNFVAPPEIVKTYERFHSFYHSKHNGRKLTWLWHLCKGELKVNYLKTAKIPYTFQVSSYQMAILLLFNDSERVSYEDFERNTALSHDLLDPLLAAFVKARVLLSSPEAAKPQAGTTYALNYNFKSKKVKVNLNISVKSETKQEVEDTHKTIEEDRKLLMQSAIVRIMKSRKRMKHVVLVQETITQIKSRFTPKIPDIKKSIDQLIDKEYLERLEDDELGYLA